MKYTINGFSQEAALNLRATVTEKGRTRTIRLDCTDLLILRWIVDFYPNMRKTIIDGAEYAWLDYKSFIEDMPLLGLSNQSLYKRCMKMVTLGVLTHKTIRSGGTFSYYGLGPEYQRLVNSRPIAAQAPAATKDAWADTTNADTTQFQAPDDEPQPLIAEPQASEQPKEPDPTEEVVNHLNSRAGTHYRATTANTRRLVKARLREGFTVEDIKRVIDKKCADWLNNPSMMEYLRPETLFGTKFESYLNAQSRPQTGRNDTTRRQNIDPAAAAYLEANAKYLTSNKGWF